MNQDLKIIKKKYGENMARLCRELFPSLLETEGLLSHLLLTKFEPNHNLYQDIIEQEQEHQFKNFIYSLVDVENNNEIKVYKTPQELLNEAGYDLYECQTEEDIQYFKKYYAKNEELCTFNGGRLNYCYVFFAVKKDIDKIKREDFIFPHRQDAYGTSVISIQFTKDNMHTLSIKNRYNHHVNNPDATFSNNLDNIIPGLTESFAQEYGLVQQNKNENFELFGYVKASDGKYYEFNQEINNVYYCPNNIIIDNFEVKRYEKEKYLIFDYFVLDLVNKKLELYNKDLEDSFVDVVANILKIDIKNTKLKKEINILTKDYNEIKIVLNSDNVMLKFESANVEKIGNNFLVCNAFIEELCLPNIKKVGNDFLYFNNSLLELNLPNLQEIAANFLHSNECLKNIYLPKLRVVGDCFLENNNALIELSLPDLVIAGSNFLEENEILKKLNLPNLWVAWNRFLCHNNAILELNLPNLERVEDAFLSYNKVLQKLSLCNLYEVGDAFLVFNESIQELDLPNLCYVGNSFLESNRFLQELNLPNLRSVGHYFLEDNQIIKNVYLPKLQLVGHKFLLHNNALLKLDLPSLKVVGNSFLIMNHTLREVILINLCEIGTDFLRDNDLLETLYLPNLLEVQSGFLAKHPRFNWQNYEKELPLSRKLEKKF